MLKQNMWPLIHHRPWKVFLKTLRAAENLKQTPPLFNLKGNQKHVFWSALFKSPYLSFLFIKKIY